MPLVISILLYLIVLTVVGYVAHYVISHFLPDPVRIPALAIVGLLLLVALLWILMTLIPTLRV